MGGKLITLKNDDLTVEISTKGAELQSVKSRKGTEFIWYGDKKIWSDRSPLLFPICGGLKDDKYVFEGKTYTLQKHGYIHSFEFETVKKSDSEAVFIHHSNDETLKQFPFDYRLKVSYVLSQNQVDVTYEVLNKSDKTMYFSIGAHEGYLCPEGIEEYSIVFEQNENLESYVLDGNLLEYNTVSVLKDSNTLDLKYDFFAVDALVFKHINSKAVTLKHKNSNREVYVDFEGFPYLLFWTKPNAPYICIEPWCGIPDSVDSNYDFASKEGIESIDAGSTFTRKHTMNFSD